MDNKERWKKMLDKLEITCSSEIYNGELIDRQYDEFQCWHISVVFDELLSVSTIKELMNQFEQEMISKIGGKRCLFEIKYNHFTKISNYLLDYYFDAINTIEPSNPIVSTLKHYQWQITGNTISGKVPNNNEKEVVEQALVFIQHYFYSLGLNIVSFDVDIDVERTDINTQHERAIKNEENTISAQAYENYQQRKLNNESNQVRDTYQYRNNNQRLDVKIADIPNTSLDLTNFTQMNGTNLVNVHGVVSAVEIREVISKKNNKLYRICSGVITDHQDSVNFQGFINDGNREILEGIKVNTTVDIVGKLDWSSYSNVPILSINKIVTMGPDNFRKRFDGQQEKRIELHAHSKMTVLDSVLDMNEYVEQAVRYGHQALAITDYENVHILPSFFKTAKSAGIKPIAGIELDFVNEEEIKISLTDEDIPLRGAIYTIFDIETTGFCINFNEIIEIGAVKVQNGVIIDTFSEFIRPFKPIPHYIEELTHITNDDVYASLRIDDILPMFKEFIKGTILVAHNARFDTDFIYENMKRLNIYDGPYPCIDTLQLARCFANTYNLKKFNLGALGKSLRIEVEQQHRAIHDARTLNNIFMKLLGDLEELGYKNYNQLNNFINIEEIFKHVIPSHLNILVKNRTGLRNLYQIVSDTQTTHFAKNPRLLKSVLDKFRGDLLVGSGDYTGEVWKAALEKTPEILKEKMKYYDYIEVQAPSYYDFLFENTKDEGFHEYIKDTIKLIIDTAKELGKIVVATGDVHELIETDRQYRKIYLSIPRPNGGGPHELNSYKEIPDCHFKNTTEMLNDFSYLPSDVAYDIVVKNTNLINSMIEDYDLFPKKLFVPEDDFLKDYNVPSMKAAIREMCISNCHKIYGEVIPKYVQERMDKELDAIIGHGYFSVYYISHLLVKDSNDNGYVVGSRGSVGSSFVAHLMNITEVNSLLPHYVCPKCHFVAFKFDENQKSQYGQFNVPRYIEDALQSVNIGFDLPELNCPVCGEKLNRDGIHINFETFLGFTGEKVPDIDLNFSGEYQANAHLFVQKMFGKEYAYRAGTISTVKLKTAAGYVRGYYDKLGIPKRNCEIERIASFIQESKRTTGQHPGGIVVVPNYMHIYDITPVQYPPLDDKDRVGELNWRTTHFDYHTFEPNLLKLDILGHDDPTMMKKLITYVNQNPDIFNFKTVDEIPFLDNKILELFSSKAPLGLDDDDIDLLPSGTIGIPEFGTDTTRRMLETIKPKTYDDIIKVSGLSHGTDVWFGNAEDLVLGKVAELNNIQVPFDDVICCRDDIMIFLIKNGVDASSSFKIMEKVRKGNGLTKDDIDLMHEKNIPEWFIWTCNKIKYLFPKAHATAYVIMALRIAWFKIYHAIYYYSVYFTVRCKEFDVEVFAAGRNAIKNRIQEIQDKIKKKEDVKDKELNLLDELYIAQEMVLRGYRFEMIDINKSDAVSFVITDDKKGLYLPFVALDALGVSVANSIIEERNKRPFSSRKDLENRTKLNKTQITKLISLGVLDCLPEEDDNALFKF